MARFQPTFAFVSPPFEDARACRAVTSAIARTNEAFNLRLHSVSKLRLRVNSGDDIGTSIKAQFVLTKLSTIASRSAKQTKTIIQNVTRRRFLLLLFFPAYVSERRAPRLDHRLPVKSTRIDLTFRTEAPSPKT